MTHKKFMINILVVTETTLTVEKKPLNLVLPWLGLIMFIETRTKLKKSLKNIMNCCKLLIVFKKSILGHAFHFKDCIPKDLTSVVDYKFHCELCNESYYGEFVRHLNISIYNHLPNNPAKIYLFKVTNRSTRKRCEIRSELTMKTPEQRH